MPLYEYLCAKCGKRSEIYQGFRDRPIRICPHCGGRVKKLTSAPAIHFKGSGWYVTDYAGKSRSEKESGDAASSGSGESKTESKTEGKTEGKTERKAEGKGERQAEGKAESKPDGRSDSKGSRRKKKDSSSE